FDGRAERRLGRRDRQLEQDVVALALEERMRRDGDLEIEVPARAASGTAFARHAHALTRANAGRNPDVELALGPLPATAAARLARLSVDVNGAVECQAGLHSLVWLSLTIALD